MNDSINIAIEVLRDQAELFVKIAYTLQQIADDEQVAERYDNQHMKRDLLNDYKECKSLLEVNKKELEHLLVLNEELSKFLDKKIKKK